MLNKKDIITYPPIRTLLENAHIAQTKINTAIDNALDRHPKTTDCIGRCIHQVKSLLTILK
ncbi:hypothetical protein HOO68_01400 [Candidatus Gracilibacteria bacterium]|nr:hypothetical protein [Candidatus Gracilibacteria bacterium]